MEADLRKYLREIERRLRTIMNFQALEGPLREGSIEE